MAESKTPQKQNKIKELVIERIFDALREKVWQAWTDAQLVKRWWGPEGFTTPVVHIDLRAGGKYLYDMRGPDGRDYWNTGTFREIKAPEYLSLTDSFADEKGNVVSAGDYGLSPDFPLESMVSVRFEESGRNKTRLNLHYRGIPEVNFADAKKGWEQSMDKLAALF